MPVQGLSNVMGVLAAPPATPLLPDSRGYFGSSGGAYVPEILRPKLLQLDQAVV